MSINSPSITNREGEFTVDDNIYRVNSNPVPQPLRLRDLESYTSITSAGSARISDLTFDPPGLPTGAYFTSNSLTMPEFKYSFPKPIEERFSDIEGLVQIMNTTIQELLLEIHELKKKCQDDNK